MEVEYPENSGKWHELQDNLTFGDYNHLGLNFKNSTKRVFNLKFTMIDSAKVRMDARNRFTVGGSTATTYSDSKPLEAGVSKVAFSPAYGGGDEYRG